MIPKKIHYCWFGGNPLPKSAIKCIDSWRKYCPDYEIVEWNESNFDVNLNEYTRRCYQEKKYAFLADYVRLYIVYHYGGIYLDTDVEVVRSFDDLLINKAFFGFENEHYANTGEGFGAEKNAGIILLMLHEYDYLLNGSNAYEACPKLNTQALEKYGFIINGTHQQKNGIRLFPVEYFNPLNSNTGKMNITDLTYSIHWYSQSWISPLERVKSKITRPFHRIFGENCFELLKKK